jgi:hypothetical protein
MEVTAADANVPISAPPSSTLQAGPVAEDADAVGAGRAGDGQHPAGERRGRRHRPVLERLAVQGGAPLGGAVGRCEHGTPRVVGCVPATGIGPSHNPT